MRSGRVARAQAVWPLPPAAAAKPPPAAAARTKPSGRAAPAPAGLVARSAHAGRRPVAAAAACWPEAPVPPAAVPHRAQLTGSTCRRISKAKLQLWPRAPAVAQVKAAPHSGSWLPLRRPQSSRATVFPHPPSWPASATRQTLWQTRLLESLPRAGIPPPKCWHCPMSASSGRYRGPQTCPAMASWARLRQRSPPPASVLWASAPPRARCSSRRGCRSCSGKQQPPPGQGAARGAAAMC
mmetsp:Transcript_33901/g.93754  ORF Transcript_33901/g.93754 Transcript_33901/m.93754 type:complete len:239 (-) Transcript_33901:828-1544(-)